MIGFLLDDGWLELASTSISVEIANPLFSYDSVPGTTTYPFTVPMTPANLRRLGFPHVRVANGQAVAPAPAQCYVDGLLWRVGLLVFEEANPERRTYQYKFVSDAGDLAAAIKGRTLDSLALGDLAITRTHDDPHFALPCIRNSAFYGEANSDYLGVLNYYFGGAYAEDSSDHRYPLVPCLRLAPLLKRVMAAFGWTIDGVGKNEVDKLIIWSNRAADVATGPADGIESVMPVAALVPAIGVGELLIQLQKLFGFGYVFDSVHQHVTVVLLRDVVKNSAYVEREAAAPILRPAAGGGTTFTMALEGSDELNQVLDTSWSRLLVGDGKNTIDTSAGTLHVVREEDAIAAASLISREWLVPAIEMKGSSSAFGLGIAPPAGLRLLYDRGLESDSNGQPYPLATPLNQKWDGTPAGSHTLHWGGENGLYEKFHRGWLEFLNAAGTEERSVRFRVGDLLKLNPAQKEMLDSRLFLWEKVSLTFHTTKRLETARFTYRPIRA